jgi:hypothetical protein
LVYVDEDSLSQSYLLGTFGFEPENAISSPTRHLPNDFMLSHHAGFRLNSFLRGLYTFSTRNGVDLSCSQLSGGQRGALQQPI